MGSSNHSNGCRTPASGGISRRFSMMKFVYLKNTSTDRLSTSEITSHTRARCRSRSRYFPMGNPQR